MAESIQHKLSRVRPPRVQITYDVELGGAIEKKELPYVIGVMADLSGKPAEPLPRVSERKFVEIDRDNFDEVLAAAAPRVAFRVPNKLEEGATDSIGVELTFKSFEDFEPESVVKQVAPLAKLLEARKRLRDLLTKLDGNDQLDELLVALTGDADQQSELRKLIDASAPADGEAAAEEKKDDEA